MIKCNLENIRKKIENAIEKSNGKTEKVDLVVVTKNRNLAEIKEVLRAGNLFLGENRIQEWKEKFDALREEAIEWHIIGHLQKNKVKYLAGKVSLIHSLDRYDLAQEINRRMEKLGSQQNCLIQVNVSGEKSKFGMKPEEAKDFVAKCQKLNFIKICGMMTIAPLSLENEDARPVFRNAFKLYSELKNECFPEGEFDYLSMGMSDDFEIAIQEGANLVRIGSAVFENNKGGIIDYDGKNT